MPLKYRPDIDGLRAIAIVSVVLYHLGIQTFSGGFVGVDIFFVISGYLISNIVFRETSENRFSIKHFYERRARRILPALFVVSIVTAYVTYRLFYPAELVEFSKSLLAATFFSSNIYFYNYLDYFSSAADRMPLLHYWSLGVEEQFYVFFPIVIIIVQRFFKKNLVAVVIDSLLISFLASAYLTHAHPPMTFYLLPFRAFELLIGSFIALPTIKGPTNNIVASRACLIGIAMLTASIFLFTTNMDFPGYAAAVPCIGTALVIWSGSSISTVPTRLLGSKPFTLIGKISYSLYLIHWPVIVFGRQLLPAVNPQLQWALFLAISLLLAVLSYLFVEQQFRHRIFRTRVKIFSFAGVSIALMAATATPAIINNGFPKRFDGRIAEILSYLQYNPMVPFRDGICFLKPEQGPQDFDQTICMPVGKQPRVLLWGDSEAAALYSGLASQFQSKGYSLLQLTASACAPILEIDVAGRPNCKAVNNFVFATIMADKPDIVILATSWDLPPDQIQKLKSMLSLLQAAKVKVIILGPLPEYKVPVPRILADRLLLGNHSTTADGEMLRRSTDNDDSMAMLSAQYHTPYISYIKNICLQNNCPLVTDKGEPIDFDVVHPTTRGSNFIANILIPLIFKVADLPNN